MGTAAMASAQIGDVSKQIDVSSIPCKGVKTPVLCRARGTEVNFQATSGHDDSRKHQPICLSRPKETQREQISYCYRRGGTGSLQSLVPGPFSPLLPLRCGPLFAALLEGDGGLLSHGSLDGNHWCGGVSLLGSQSFVRAKTYGDPSPPRNLPRFVYPSRSRAP